MIAYNFISIILLCALQPLLKAYLSFSPWNSILQARLYKRLSSATLQPPMPLIVSLLLPILGFLVLPSFAAPTSDPLKPLNATNCWFCDLSQRNVFPFLAWQNSGPATIPAQFAISSLEQYRSKLLNQVQTSSLFAHSPFRSVKTPIFDYNSHVYQFIMASDATGDIPPMTNSEAYGVVSNLLSQIKRAASNRRMLPNLGFDIWGQMQDQRVLALGGGSLRDVNSANGLQSDQHTA